MKQCPGQLTIYDIQPPTPPRSCEKLRRMKFDDNLPPVTAALAALVKRHMDRTGASFSEIALAAGLNRSNLTRYMNGEREPRSHNLADVEAAIGEEYGTVYALAAKIAKKRVHVVRTAA